MSNQLQTHAPTFLLETKRLRVRAARPNDAEDYHRLQTDEKTMKYLGGPSKKGVEQSRSDLIRLDCNDIGLLIVESKESDGFIGRCGLTDLSQLQNGDWEVHIVLAPESQGKNLGLELFEVLRSYAKQHLGALRLIGFVHKQHQQCIGMLRRLGMIDGTGELVVHKVMRASGRLVFYLDL